MSFAGQVLAYAGWLKAGFGLGDSVAGWCAQLRQPRRSSIFRIALVVSQASVPLTCAVCLVRVGCTTVQVWTEGCAAQDIGEARGGCGTQGLYRQMIERALVRVDLGGSTRIRGWFGKLASSGCASLPRVGRKGRRGGGV